MPFQKVKLQAQDGAFNTWIFTPDNDAGTLLPAVIFYMDAFAIRPALFTMAQHLSDLGYLVALPDLFYRLGEYDTLVPEEVFQGDFMSVIGPMMASTDNHKAVEDTRTIIDYIKSHPDYNGGKLGTFGLCMGGGMAITAAGFFPDDIAAVASFHAGSIATDDATSPHWLASKIKAELYVAGADADQHYPTEMASRFAKAMTEAGVKHRCEIYKGALHGFMKPDFPVYNEQAAKLGWEEAEALFSRTLR